MKRFTSLCAAILAAMIALPALADGVDVTSKMTNPDGSQKLKGWKVDYDRKGLGTGQNWSPSNHNGEKEYGFWGWVAPNFEMWNASQTVVDANTLSQKINNLPNGTYVFSAFCAALRSGFDQNDPEDYKQAYGGYIFANGDTVAVATNGQVGDITEGKWMHTRRFRVATKVTDGKLKVGIGAKAETNLFYLGMDGVQLYSFGDMAPEKALFAMADIQLNQDKAIADSLMEYPMTAEGAQGLKNAYVAYLSVQSYEDVLAAEDSMFVACAWARKGIKSMSGLVNLVAEAKEVAEGEWSDEVAQQVVDLKKAIANAEAVLKENSLYESGVSEYKKELQEAVNQVRIDELWAALDALNVFLDSPEEISEDNPCFGVTSHPGFGNEEGQYLANQEEILRALVEEVTAALEAVQSYEMTATTALEYVDRIEKAVATCVATANSAVKSLPYKWITIPDPNDPTKPYWSTYSNWDNDPFLLSYVVPTMLCGCEAEVYQVISPTFRLDYPVKQLSFQILESGNGGVNTLMDELYIIDGDGYRIKLPDSQISCNFTGWSSWQGSTYQAFFDDSDIQDYWHSGGNRGSDGYQTVTFTLDEAIDQFYFVIENRHHTGRIASLPLSINILGANAVAADLKAALDEVESLGTFYAGTNPGFYANIPAAYLDAVANAKTLLNKGGSDAEMIRATYALYDCIDLLSDMKANPIEEGVEYMISCAFPGFHQQSRYRVAMSLFQDSILWWEPADPSNPNQKWTFEYLDGPDEDGNMYYNVKNVGTGKYLTTFLGAGTAFEPTGEEITWGNPEYVKTSDTAGRWRLFEWGDGSWGFRSEIFPGNWGTCHALNHNNGVWSSRIADQGCGRSSVHPNGFGQAGQCSAMGNWEAGGASMWYIFPDMTDVPVADAVAGKVYHFPLGSKCYSLTANGQKFDDLHFYDLNGNEMSFEKKNTANSVIVQFKEFVVDFSFTFAGSDGVKVTIDAASFEVTKYELLQQAYNKVKKDYVEGTDVGCMKSLKDYNAAIEKAEALLENGGTDDELVAATDALYAAVDGLEVIYPDEEKTYIIVNANPWMENIGQDLAMFNYQPTGTLGYSYLDEQDPAFQWKFKAAPEKGEHHYYIINVADETNVGYAWALETHIPMSTDSCTYELGLTDTYNAVYFHADFTTDQYYSLHCSSRGNTNGILYWEAAATGTRWYVREITNEDTHVYDLEDLVGPATSEPKAIYDLFGRRVVNPEKGVFIIDGKKKYVK